MQVSLLVGIFAADRHLPGTSVGLLAGYAGGWTDSLLMRLVDLLLSIPFPVLMALAAFWGKGALILILGLLVDGHGSSSGPSL
ncbi:hypothetical protein MASR2M17_23790 [Aminivibrio sp.]